MQLVYSPYMLLPLFAVIMALVLVQRGWRYRSTRLGQTFLVLMFALVWWSLAVVMEYLSPGLPAKILWMKMSYFGITVIPVAWLVFTLRYTDRGKWLTRRNIALLSIMPVITLIMVWTDSIHHLMWRAIWLETSLSPPVDAVTHNAWFYVYAVYAYSLLLLGILYLVGLFRQATGIYRRQAGTLLLAALVPWVGNLLYIAGVGPFAVVDPTPLAFAITGAAFFWGMSRFQLMDIMPIAYDTILRSMLDAAIVLDNRQRIVELNPAARKLIGRERAEVIGQPYNRVLPGQAGLLELYSGMTETKALIALGEGQGLRYFEVSITPLSAPQHPGGHLVILHDDTEGLQAEIAARERAILETELNERRQAADELARLNEELRSLNLHLETKVEERTRQLEETASLAQASSRAKSEFLASMSHELRTPLTAIIGFSQVLNEQYFGSLNDKQAEYVRDILDSGKHLLALISDILDLSKIEAGKLELEISGVIIADLLQNSLVMIKEKALMHGISLEIQLGEAIDGTEIVADERRLKQVMFNLLSNAAKFTPDGGAIRVEARKEGKELIVSVSDTGIGMTPQEQKRLFEKFYQASGGIRDKTPGTGLGLAITKSIVDKHGGRVWMESEGLNKGSRFTFTLPIRD
jgi:signal transduction histidine kinase